MLGKAAGKKGTFGGQGGKESVVDDEGKGFGGGKEGGEGEGAEGRVAKHVKAK